MKTTFRLLAILAFVLVTLGQPSNASAGNADQVVWARALFETVDSSGCIFTRVSIDALEPLPQVQVYIYQEDTCTGSLLMNGYGYTYLDRSALQIAGNLDSATISAKVPIYDRVSNSSRDVFVDVMWTATSPITRYTSNYRERRFVGPGMCNSIEHDYYRYRDAQASGTVSNGEINFTPEPSVSADLSLQKQTYRFGCDSMMEATLRQQLPAATGNLEHSKFTGVYAHFQQEDPSGCITTYLNIGAMTIPLHSGDKYSWATVELLKYDWCNSRVVLDAVNYYIPLADSDFKLAGNSATLNKTATVRDNDQDKYIDVFVDLTWTASGPMNQTVSNFQWHSPDCDEHSHYAYSWRAGKAWGTISSTEIDLTSTELGYAEFFEERYVGNWCG